MMKITAIQNQADSSGKLAHGTNIRGGAGLVSNYLRARDSDRHGGSSKNSVPSFLSNDVIAVLGVLSRVMYTVLRVTRRLIWEERVGGI